ncbi:MAG: type II secretion system protein [Erysipelotrichaceae bacterium]|nr:type II secretion system protein [Erysipelotrichaceae bacterium]
MKKRHKNKNGFTLAELLIVTAIIGVLAAVSIPIFTASLKKTKETACMANRRSLLAAFRTSEMLNPGGSEQDWINDAAKSVEGTVNGNQVSGICPEGGTYTITLFKDNTVTITCSKHTDDAETFASNMGEIIIKNISQITRQTSDGNTQALTEYLKNGKQIDSDSPEEAFNSGITESWTHAINQKLKLTSSRMWMIKKSGDSYIMYMTEGTVKPTSSGQTVTVTKYTYNSDGSVKSKETAEVTTASIGSGSSAYIVLKEK